MYEDEQDDEPLEVEQPPKKLSPTEMLKLQMKAKEQKSKSKRKKSTVFEDDLSPLRREMESYERLKDEEEGVDMLLWWKDHSEAFPLLAFLVRVVFSVPAASSIIERVISAAGSVDKS